MGEALFQMGPGEGSIGGDDHTGYSLGNENNDSFGYLTPSHLNNYIVQSITTSEVVPANPVLGVVLKGNADQTLFESIECSLGTFLTADAASYDYDVDSDTTLWVWSVASQFTSGEEEDITVAGPNITDTISVYDAMLTSVASIASKVLSKYSPPIIISHDNVIELPETYGAAYPLGISNIGRSYSSTFADSQSVYYIQSHYELRVQYTFVGSKSYTLANTLHQRIIDNPFTLEDLSRRNMSVFRRGDVLPAPQKRETKWVEGFTLDVHFGYGISVREVIDTVETVNLIDPLTNEQYTITIP